MENIENHNYQKDTPMDAKINRWKYEEKQYISIVTKYLFLHFGVTVQ